MSRYVFLLDLLRYSRRLLALSIVRLVTSESWYHAADRTTPLERVPQEAFKFLLGQQDLDIQMLARIDHLCPLTSFSPMEHLIDYFELNQASLIVLTDTRLSACETHTARVFRLRGGT